MNIPDFDTRASKAPGVYTKFFNRPGSIIGCEFWDRGERVEGSKICEDITYFEPLLIYRAGKGVAAYYNETDPNQDPEAFVDYFNAHPKEFHALVDFYEERFPALSSLLEKADSDLHTVGEYLVSIWPALTLASVLANECRDRTEPSLAERILDLRRRTDSVSYIADAYVLDRLRREVPPEYQPYVEFLQFDEATSGQYPSMDELTKRSSGYVYFRGNLFVQPVEEFIAEQGFTLEEEKPQKDGEVRGSPAWRGKVRGKARVIFEASQAGTLEEGEILITPMTSPDFLSAMRKAAAFVTDEGGVTCHAAIIAREMKKPCVIGTKVATQVFKDGDLIEVDGEKGIARVIIEP